MKKSLIIIVSCIAGILSCIAGILLIGGLVLAVILSTAGSNSPEKLTTPAVTLQDDIATWGANSEADKFEISVDGNLSYVENSTTSKKLMDGQTFKVRAIGDGVNTLNSDWSNAVTYIKSIPTYTITWKNGDTVLKTDTGVEAGEVPTYDGPEPTKEADAQYTYVFAGWTPTVVPANEDVTYSAVFAPVTQKYTVTWMNGDTILETDNNIEYGAIPTYDGEEPHRDTDTQYIYIFNGWSPTISEVVGNVTYEAQFESVPNSFTIIWKNGDAILETDANVSYGSTPSYDGAIPTKDATEQFTFTFSGWAPEINSVTESVTYYAQFTQQVRSYSVTFYSEDGSRVLDTVTVEYGSNAEYSKSTPVKNPTEAYTYVFEKWVTTQGGTVTDNLTHITGDRAVYASFKAYIRKVTVYIVSNNPDYGAVSISEVDNVPYGSEIVAQGNTITINGQTITAQTNTATAKYTYQFVDWTADSTVGHDTIIMANFKRSVNQYTITWMNGDEVLEVDEHMDFGTVPVYNGPLPTKMADAEHSYTFSGWSPAVSAVTGDMVYTAQFSTTDNTYTVTFYDEDGTTILGVAVVKYNSAATYPNATPVKQPTVAIAYTFDKWVTAVNGDMAADLTAVTTNVNVYAKYTSEARKYAVTFCDWDGNVLETQSVAYGLTATAPENPYRAGYRFNGWDIAFESIIADTRITATYVRQYLVEFVDYDYSIIDIQFVDHGADAIQPDDPVRQNHIFIGWNTTCTNIVSDLTVKAQYIRQYKVTFIDFDGTILATDVVNSGGKATPPPPPTRVGYTFISWDQSYDYVTSDIEVVAVYEINRYTVTFVNPDGSVIETISNITHGTTITPSTPDIYFDWNTHKGYRFTGWHNWNESDPVEGDMTIVADYANAITDPIIAIETVEITKGTTTAEVSVYLCGALENIYGISLNLGYAEQLVFKSESVMEINSDSARIETTAHTDRNQFELSWADGQGMTLNKPIKVLTLTFSINKSMNPGEYIIATMEGTYIIDESLTKLTPIVVVGHIVITE